MTHMPDSLQEVLSVEVIADFPQSSWAVGAVKVQQRAGLSSAMLADMQPSADGRSDTVKIKLTPAMVSLFRNDSHTLCLRLS